MSKEEQEEIVETILEAVKAAESNLDIERDMRNTRINKEKLENNLVNDSDLQDKALKKVNNNGYRK